MQFSTYRSFLGALIALSLSSQVLCSSVSPIQTEHPVSTSSHSVHVAHHPKPAGHRHHAGRTARRTQSQGIDLAPGSLKAIVERVAGHFGWHRVIWRLPNDYRWAGHATIHSQDEVVVMTTILQDFPVQATFYQGNHVVVVTARVLR